MWYYGWGNSSYQLIAPLHPFQPPFYWVAKIQDGPFIVGAVCLGPDPFSDTWGAFSPPITHPHFPYGFVVDPD